MDISKIDSKTLASVLSQYADRGNYLYKKLFFGSYPINNIEEAQKYIEESREYKFISHLFRQLCIYDWLEV